MKQNPTRYSSAVGEIWVMATFKVKYCHKIFDILAVRLLCITLFYGAFHFYMSGIYHWSIDQWTKSTIIYWKVIYS
jgi:hypothetical protein